MSPELTRKIQQHLLSERSLLDQMFDEWEPVSHQNLNIQMSECESLLLQIERELNEARTVQSKGSTTTEGGNGQ